jgi:anaerobic selenocysteine-containing dehydrogenase
MADQTRDALRLERRKFLKGSALFAAAFGAGLMASTAMPASAQEPARQEPADKDKPAEPKKDAGDGDAPKKLLDAKGREYRVCDMCGGNMYKQENTWTCEQCGYSYEE